MGFDVDISLPAPIDFTGGVDKVASNLGYIKKLGSAVKAGIKFGLYVAEKCHLDKTLPTIMKVININAPSVINVITTNNNLIEFYSTYKNIIFWINPIDDKSINKEAMAESLKDQFVKFYKEKNEEISDQDNQSLKELSTSLVSETFNHVFKKHKRYLSKKSFQKHFNHVLQHKIADLAKIGDDYRLKNSQNVSKIVKGVEVTQNKRSAIVIVSTFFFTIADLGENILSLNKMGVLPLSKIASHIGQVKGLNFVAKIAVTTGLEVVFGTAACIALSIVFVNSTHQLIINHRKINELKQKIKETETEIRDLGEEDKTTKLEGLRATLIDLNKEKKDSTVKRTQAIWDMVTSGADFVNVSLSVATPFIMAAGVVINPAIPLTVGLVAKGIGLISVFAKPS